MAAIEPKPHSSVGASGIPITVSPTPPVRSSAACRLPVTWGGSDGVAGGGGFINFPGGAFETDPSAHPTTPFGSVGLSYDRSASRWIPVPGRHASLDGSTYIYYAPRKGVEIHAVSVRTGADIVLARDQDQMWDPIGLDNRFVYAMLGATSQATDLWRIPLDGGKASQVTTGGHWLAVTAGSAWGTDADLPSGMPLLLTRLDLTTGQTTRWGSFDDNATLLGFDAVGWPVMTLGDIDGAVVVLPSAGVMRGVARLVLPLRPGYDHYAPAGALGDAHGIWLTGADGIYLSVDGNATKVSSVHAFPAGTCG